MTSVVTEAIVLHVMDYLETSRIYRLATRELGVVSVLGRGAKTSKKRFGAALDLFAQGTAQIQIKTGRDLHTLLSCDVHRVRPALAADLGRFAAANALAETVMRVVHEENAPRVFDTISHGLDLIAAVPADRTVGAALGVMWRLVTDSGFGPALDRCADCHAVVVDETDTVFSHTAGGVLCDACSRRASGGRRLPWSARATLRRLVAADTQEPSEVLGLASGEGRAHQRLFREFITQHFTDSRALRAYADWESGVYVA